MIAHPSQRELVADADNHVTEDGLATLGGDLDRHDLLVLQAELGGIGQSRLCMLMLEKAHIGEVQVSVWPAEMVAECEQHGILML